MTQRRSTDVTWAIWRWPRSTLLFISLLMVIWGVFNLDAINSHHKIAVRKAMIDEASTSNPSGPARNPNQTRCPVRFVRRLMPHSTATNFGVVSVGDKNTTARLPSE